MYTHVDLALSTQFDSQTFKTIPMSTNQQTGVPRDKSQRGLIN
jgi:hypothetical protein